MTRIELFDRYYHYLGVKDGRYRRYNGYILSNTSHSTALEGSIYVEIDNKPILVYFMRQWYNPDHYGFNDKYITKGIQPGFEFLQPQIDGIFIELKNAKIAVEEEIKRKTALKLDLEQEEHRKIVERVKALYS